MIGYRFLLSTLVIAALTVQASAGIFFHRKPKPDPVERVPALLVTLRTGQEERKRAAAAEELRAFDPAAYGEIIPSLIGALQSDPSPSVRLEALLTLSKFRPVSQQVGAALEQAMHQDASWRVRLQARSSYMQYRLSGYRPAVPAENVPTAAPKIDEPPLAPPLDKLPTSTIKKSAVPPASIAPPIPSPLAQPNWTPRPLPPGPPVVPADPPPLKTPPAPTENGPELTPSE